MYTRLIRTTPWFVSPKHSIFYEPWMVKLAHDAVVPIGRRIYAELATSGDADDLGSVIPNVDQDTLLLANRVHINRCVDIHDPASVQNELKLFVGHFEDVSAV